MTLFDYQMTMEEWQTVSKTQEKRAARLAESQAFVTERRKYQLAYLEANFNIGVQMYQDNKDNISDSDRVAIEDEMAKQREFLDKLKADAGLDEQ